MLDECPSRRLFNSGLITFSFGLTAICATYIAIFEGENENLQGYKNAFYWPRHRGRRRYDGALLYLLIEIFLRMLIFEDMAEAEVPALPNLVWYIDAIMNEESPQ